MTPAGDRHERERRPSRRVHHAPRGGRRGGPIPLAEADAVLTAPGQLFEIETIEIQGIPTKTWRHAPPTLRSVLELSRGHGDADYLVYEDERTTFAEHYRLAAGLARLLVEQFGLRKGERVAIAMRNLPEWVVAFWAATAAGAIAVPLNAWWTGPELRYGLADSASAIVDTERLQRIAPHPGELPELRAVLVADEHRRARLALPSLGVQLFAMREMLDAIAAGGGEPSLPDVELAPEDDATIFYTSGTTGPPKGALGTHRNITTALMSLFYVVARGAYRQSGSIPSLGAGDTNSYLLSVPLFHATGCHAILVTNTAAGGKLVMMHHWDPERALELIERERITTFGGVPAMVMEVLDSPSFAERDTSSVRSVAFGGAPAPPELVRRIEEHFPGRVPSNGYGLTETSSITTMNSGEDYLRKPDSVGPPVPVCDVAVVPEGYEAPEPTADLPHGPHVIGELWIKGPNVVKGYWRKPEETARSFTAGWLHTGDLARIDEEGFVYIVDRAKDLVIRGGENISSVEVEAVLFEHPAVADCAVVGVPHPILGEEVGAVVVVRPGEHVTPEELMAHARRELAAYKVPTRFWFHPGPLPRNPQGKVLKRALKEAFAATVEIGGHAVDKAEAR
jgi:long-chain acyl-CoA synthetase